MFRRRGRDAADKAELESAAADPALWDDGDNARAVTTELGQVTADLEQLSGLRRDLSDAVVLLELINESRAEGAPDGALEKELVETVDALRTRLGALELQSLFSGEYDERDAVVRRIELQRLTIADPTLRSVVLEEADADMLF